jgi:hypothetical protein
MATKFYTATFVINIELTARNQIQAEQIAEALIYDDDTFMVPDGYTVTDIEVTNVTD